MRWTALVRPLDTVAMVPQGRIDGPDQVRQRGLVRSLKTRREVSPRRPRFMKRPWISTETKCLALARS
jgi:hypothetical protein